VGAVRWRLTHVRGVRVCRCAAGGDSDASGASLRKSRHSPRRRQVARGCHVPHNSWTHGTREGTLGCQLARKPALRSQMTSPHPRDRTCMAVGGGGGARQSARRLHVARKPAPLASDSPRAVLTRTSERALRRAVSRVLWWVAGWSGGRWKRRKGGGRGAGGGREEGRRGAVEVAPLLLMETLTTCALLLLGRVALRVRTLVCLLGAKCWCDMN